jgi:hypothetical protein
MIIATMGRRKGGLLMRLLRSTRTTGCKSGALVMSACSSTIVLSRSLCCNSWLLWPYSDLILRRWSASTIVLLTRSTRK